MDSAFSGPVLITGCSSGIGRAAAERLAARGHRVYATARRRESIEDLAAKGCQLLELDVTDEDSMRAAVSAAEEKDGAVGVLVNNAGYSQSGAIETISPGQVRREFETNVFGLIRMCQLVLPGMRRQGRGTIVNIGSVAGRLTLPGGGIYAASKHAVEAISDALRFETAGFGIDIVLIEPGLIRTRFAQTAIAEVPARGGDGAYGAFNAAVAKATGDVYKGPLGRLGGDPAAVARVIETAITARHPHARYLVTPSARAQLGLHALLPGRGWDRVMRSFVSRPGAVAEAR